MYLSKYGLSRRRGEPPTSCSAVLMSKCIYISAFFILHNSLIDKSLSMYVLLNQWSFVPSLF